MTVQKYEPHLSAGSRVVFIGREQHPKNGQHCTILAALPNPSRSSEHQWYDVRFEDYTAGRFLEKYLQTNEQRSHVA